MANFLITNRIENPEGLLSFKDHGYMLSKSDSTEEKPVFVRKEKDREAA